MSGKSLKFIVGVLVAVALLQININTDAQGIGWQHDDFADNVIVQITPESPTTSDQIVVTIQSRYSEVHINQADMRLTIIPDMGDNFDDALPFRAVNNTAMQCVINPYAYPRYDLVFYIWAYDVLNQRIISNDYYFSLEGSGWKHDGFEDNIELIYEPMSVNATEPVTVTIISRENIPIAGANLWWVTRSKNGTLSDPGGYPFAGANSNNTIMIANISKQDAGTTVTFWAEAWDSLSFPTIIVSDEITYNVLSEMKYTDFPFEYTKDDGTGNFDRSKWYPGLQIVIPMAIMCALGIPLFLYLFVTSKKKEKKTQKLVDMGEGGEEPGGE